MIAAQTAGGASFRGAALYYLHDRRLESEAERLTSDRVAWTHICNLPTDDPERAWRMMAHTALAQAELKAAAGIKATGRKLTKPVAAYSLAWHPDELPTKDEQLAAALDSLRALGLAEHQALIVCHTDARHPHVHIMLNRVHPFSGIAAKLGNSRLKLSAWAEAYERAHGHIRCAARVENNARRGRQPCAAVGGPTAQFQRHAAGRTVVSPAPPRPAGPAPALSLAGLTRDRSTFTRADLARFVERHTGDADERAAVLAALDASPDLIALGPDGKGIDRFTTRDQQAIERRMAEHAGTLRGRRHPAGDVMPRCGPRISLSDDQEAALRHALAAPGLAAIVGYAGSGKSTLLGAARQSWEAAGCRVLGAALSGVAADGLKSGAGIDSPTIHRWLLQWERGRNLLRPGDVLVIDEAGMIGSRQMERLLFHAREARAKVVLVGDPEQLQAIEAGGAFRAIADRIGAARLTTVRRQTAAWQQDATRELATARTAQALRRYEAAGMLHTHADTDAARAAVIEAWHAGGRAAPDKSQIILAYTRSDVRALNALARARLRADGGLGPDAVVHTAQGERSFAPGDRMYFLKSDTGLAVRNGTLATIERIEGAAITVRLDGDAARRVTFSALAYSHIDHGYAATIHKSQGMTVDRTHLLVSRHLDRHSAYVAMTRHRDRLDMHWAADAIPGRAQLDRILGRARAKDTSLDYDAAPGDSRPPSARSSHHSPLLAAARRAFAGRSWRDLFATLQKAPAAPAAGRNTAAPPLMAGQNVIDFEAGKIGRAALRASATAGWRAAERRAATAATQSSQTSAARTGATDPSAELHPK